MDFKNKNILVYGMGVSGRGAASMLHAMDLPAVLFDSNMDLDQEALIEKLGFEPEEIVTGELTDLRLDHTDILVLSPGVSAFAPDIERARAKGVTIIGEIELAYQLSKGRIAAITGTNGKTTTTALVGEIMKAAYDEVFVVGNIGNSFADAALKTTDASVIAAEISSFQLETTIDFHPQVSAVLNLTPDHLDRHGSFENYALCKMDIAKKQTADEYCVINYEDEYLRELAKNLPCKAAAFSSERILDEGAYLEGDNIVLKYGEPVVICRTDELNLLGKHNFENVMAAVLIAFHMGVSTDIISKVVKEFKAVEHRIEYVCTKGGVKYYNDSKGTNTDASSKAIDAMPTPCILIAGGYDKGADFTDWINGFGDKVAEMILIGQTAGKIRETAEKCGYSHVTDAADLKEAVDMAAKMAAPGMCVLLSPACASWGQFSNYEQRGRMFKEYAESIQD